MEFLGFIWVVIVQLVIFYALIDVSHEINESLSYCNLFNYSR